MHNAVHLLPQCPNLKKIIDEKNIIKLFIDMLEYFDTELDSIIIESLSLIIESVLYIYIYNVSLFDLQTILKRN